jgi:tRNA(Leu) C34 or U34 (ribose-2'-O)-methylase TrmL
MNNGRGYFGIGVWHFSIEFLSCLHFYYSGAAFIFTIHRRYSKQPSDTPHTYLHTPLYHYKDWDSFLTHKPYDCPIVCIEFGIDNCRELGKSIHPERAIYLLGAEDIGLPTYVLSGRQVISIPTLREPGSLNVASAGSIVMYDRYVKLSS